MTMPDARAVRLPLFTLSAVVFVAALWFFQVKEGTVDTAPVAEWQWLSAQWLEPVAEQRLTVAQLRQDGGALWLQAKPTERRLLYRAEISHEGQLWRVQALITATPEQLQALAELLQLKQGEQVLTVEQAQNYAAARVEQLWLQREPYLSDGQWRASAGEPRLQLQMPEGLAWVYPQRGLTAHLQNQQVTLIHQVSAQAMRGQAR